MKRSISIFFYNFLEIQNNVLIIVATSISICNVQSQETNNDKNFIEYISYGNIDKTTIIKEICVMSNFDTNHGIDSINKMINNRSIYINTQISDTVSEIVQSLLLYYESISKNDILIYINSPGGSVYAGLGIYDAMQYIQNDVSTICTGTACSMAAVLLMAGTEGKRYATSNSRIMIHQPSLSAEEKTTNLEVSIKELNSLRKELYTIISTHCHKSFEKISEDCSRDYWMNAAEAKEYGIIDMILQ